MILVIYHANCVDGFTSAWAIWDILRDSAEYKPHAYGDDLLPYAGRYTTIYFVDFSAPREVLAKLAETSAVVVLDHHKTAAAALAEPIPGVKVVFDMNKCGARLSWEHCHQDKTAPVLVEYVEDRDLWRKVLKNTDEISAAIWLTPRTFEAWMRLARELEHDSSGVAACGATVLAVQKKQVQDAVGRLAVLDGVVRGNVVENISEVGHAALAAFPLAAYSDTYFDLIGENKRVHSLRSRKGGVDVSAIAKSHGGGGHANAAGYTTALA